MKYLIVYEKTSTGFSAYVPDLSGCVASGKDRAEVEMNIREAIELHILGMKADGESLCPPLAFSEYREIHD